MELKILYDNEAKDGFMKEWGFSCLVGDELLFDTGGDVNILLFNMHRFSVNLRSIRLIVLSHEHGDHIGGIKLVRELGDVDVFIPRSFSNSFKSRLAAYSNVNLIDVTEAREISQNVFTLGELGSFIKEQSLLLRTDKGFTVLTGCSHPGLEHILGYASKFGEINGVVGGFHGFNRLDALSEMKVIVPCHCTRRKKEMLRHYPESGLQCAAGRVIEV